MLLRHELAGKPIDRGMILALSEFVQTDGRGLVADISCDPGRITPYLHSLGRTTIGIDLSPGMIAVARDELPRSGSRREPWKPPRSRTSRWAASSRGTRSFTRARAHNRRTPTVAFQSGDETRHITRAYGHDLDLDAYRLSADRVTTLLADSAPAVHSQLLRAPDGSEKIPQAFLLARKV